MVCLDSGKYNLSKFAAVPEANYNNRNWIGTCLYIRGIYLHSSPGIHWNEHQLYALHRASSNQHRSSRSMVYSRFYSNAGRCGQNTWGRLLPDSLSKESTEIFPEKPEFP